MLDLFIEDIRIEVDIKLRVTDIDDLVFFGEELINFLDEEWCEVYFSFKVGIDMVIIFLANGLSDSVRDFQFLGIEVICLRGTRGEEDLS